MMTTQPVRRLEIHNPQHSSFACHSNLKAKKLSPRRRVYREGDYSDSSISLFEIHQRIFNPVSSFFHINGG
jgi:hypothetical protein